MLHTMITYVILYMNITAVLNELKHYHAEMDALLSGSRPADEVDIMYNMKRSNSIKIPKAPILITEPTINQRNEKENERPPRQIWGQEQFSVTFGEGSIGLHMVEESHEAYGRYIVVCLTYFMYAVCHRILILGCN